MEPLNPILYQVLQEQFGNVRISNEGEPRRVIYTPEYTDSGVRLRAETIEAGEEYRIACPFCSDTRGRLYINHCYGVQDETTGSYNHHLIYCFNEKCHENEANRETLKSRIEISSFYSQRSQRPAVLRTDAPEPLQRAELPPGLTPVSELPADHPAAQYLHDRGFDLAELSTKWHVSYCESAPDTQPPIYERIIIPIYRPPVLQAVNPATHVSNVLAGWQARFVGEPPEETPKYLFAAGLRKSRLLYGLPEALQAPGPVVICEGPTDVWRFGTNAVALFGKSVSSEQQRLILHHFAGRPIVIALDADAREEAEEMRARLETARGFGPGDNRVVLLELPVGASDPAASTREVLNNRLTQSLEIQEISK